MHVINWNHKFKYLASSKRKPIWLTYQNKKSICNHCEWWNWIMKNKTNFQPNIVPSISITQKKKINKRKKPVSNTRPEEKMPKKKLSKYWVTKIKYFEKCKIIIKEKKQRKKKQKKLKTFKKDSKQPRFSCVW